MGMVAYNLSFRSDIGVKICIAWELHLHELRMMKCMEKIVWMHIGCMWLRHGMVWHELGIGMGWHGTSVTCVG